MLASHSEHGPAGVDVPLGVYTPEEILALENVPFISSPGAPISNSALDSPLAAGTHESNVLTFVLDFKESSQGNTTDIFGNVVSDFDITAFGFTAVDYQGIIDGIREVVRDDFFDELVESVDGPVESDLAIDFITGNIGTPPPGAGEYYYIQIGTGIAGPHSGGTLGVAGAGVVRTASGSGPNFGVSVGSVVGSVFTDAINSLSNLVPGNALTAGYFGRTLNAIAGTVSHEIGHTVSLSHIDKSGSIQPTTGVSPLMGTGSVDLPNVDRISDREFSLSGVDSQSGGAARQQIQQLSSAIGLHSIPAGTVQGVVYNDLNENGKQDAGELGIRDVTVYADYNNNNVPDPGEPATVTNVNGVYTLAGIVADDVIIRQASGVALRQTGSESTSILFTEFSEQTPDFIEIQNVSGVEIDTSGWFIASSNGFDTNPLSLNSPNPLTFSLPTLLAPGEILTVTDSISDPNYWGVNLNFVTTTGSWLLLIDDTGTVRDSFFAGWAAQEIFNFDVTVGGVRVTAADLDWKGHGVPLTVGGATSYQRVGLGDTNTAADFVLQTQSPNVSNLGLVPQFGFTSAGRVIEGVGGNTLTGVDFGNLSLQPPAPTFFTARVPSGDRELHITDGTASGTVLVRDLAGSVSSDPDHLTWSGNELYFVATTIDGQRELFTSDGTFSGTSLVRDLSGSVSSEPMHLTMIGNTVFFTALTSSGQRELYRSGGNFSSTTMVRNLSGAASAQPEDLTVLGSQLFFSALTSSGQRELYVTDGTFSGTRMVRDLSGATSSDPDELTVVGGKLYFSALQSNGQRELFSSDGTAAGTRIVKNLNDAFNADPQELTRVGNGLYFTATVGSSERELYFTDGSSSGTFIVNNLPGNGNPSDLTAVKSKLYFVARAAGDQRELYLASQNGTSSRLIRDLSGGFSSTPQSLTALDSQLIFSALRTNGQRELFVSNGTFGGTSLVRDLYGTTSSTPLDLTATDNAVYFSALQSSGQRELHRTNGTLVGTVLIDNLSDALSSAPEDIRFAFGFAVPGESDEQSESLDIGERPVSEDPKIETGDLTGNGLDSAAPHFDVNGDGKTTLRDALMVINLLALQLTRTEQTTPVASIDAGPDPEMLNGDVTGDGFVSPRDALAVINQLALETSLPRWPSSDSESTEDEENSGALSENLEIDGPILRNLETPPAIEA